MFTSADIIFLATNAIMIILGIVSMIVFFKSVKEEKEYRLSNSYNAFCEERDKIIKFFGRRD